jgi:hypothetical protein
LLFDEAKGGAIKVAVSVKNYGGRTAATLSADVANYVSRFGAHPAALTHAGRAVVLVYDAQDAAGLPRLWGGGPRPFLVGTGTEFKHFAELAEEGYGGLATYYVTRQSFWSRDEATWEGLSEFSEGRGVAFVPTVGPGHNDSLTNRWNPHGNKERAAGEFYGEKWANALRTTAAAVLINSFNNFLDGTQIEPSAPLDDEHREEFRQFWGSDLPNFYLDLTLKFAQEFKK